MFRYLLVLILFAVVLPVKGQTPGDLHPFTDKSGKQILASLMSVSEDKRTMKIRREDGLEFDLVINVLSLDDQQFIKDQLATLPTQKTEYRLEVDIAKKVVSTDSYEYSSSEVYTFEEEFCSYAITVKNLSRETLAGATLEWVIAWDDRITVFERDDEWTYSTRASDEDKNLTQLSGEVVLDEIPFNQEAAAMTDVFEIEEMYYYRDIYRADEMLGVIARIVAEDGTVITEAKIGGAEINEMTWDGVIALKAPAGN